ncbi:MAG: N-acetylmuramoyl-L-alanine amidase [Clostridia bacterium]|nr:N-acetylmuramoyl-L-alanine amidase [Clostridia bacterium]
MKQKTLFISFGAVFLTVALLCSVLFQTIEGYFLSAAPTSTEAVRSPVIILDAGHGGEDGGATGTNGVLEKDLNLSMTRGLAALLRLAGYTVVETRTEDKLLYPAGTQKGHKKQGDLSNRLAFTEQYPNSLFVSIHMNTFPTPSCEGVQVWYSQNHEASKEFATAVQSEVTARLQPSNHRKIKAATSNIYILRHAKTPAILIECGFLSTPAECERLCDPLYRQELTLALFAAISEKTALPT